MTVTVYSKPNCGACLATARTLDKIGVDYTKKDITEDSGAYEFIKGLGALAAPVVYVEETGEFWAGFRPERIAALAA